LVERKLVSRVVNPRGNREVLVSLTRSGLAVHDVMVPGLWSAASACWMALAQTSSPP
jgi:DNA-binding MarR family transcriptional regulator